MDLSRFYGESTMGPLEEPKKADDIDLRSSAVTPHAEAVQALRKYLLRKKSSEESSGDKDFDYTPGKVISVAELDGSKLYCSLVPKPDVVDVTDHQGNRRCLAKHKSLELEDSPHVSTSTRYLRTDLCIPVLWNKCSFCDDFFEDEENLRKHLRDSHFQYFLNCTKLRPLTTTKSLSDLPFSSALSLSEHTRKSEGDEQIHETKYSHQKKRVKCQVCQKSFTNKWNCKQHLKCHAKESSATFMDTECCPNEQS